jgi:hypothetical protein
MKPSFRIESKQPEVTLFDDQRCLCEVKQSTGAHDGQIKRHQFLMSKIVLDIINASALNVLLSYSTFRVYSTLLSCIRGAKRLFISKLEH